MHNVSPLTEVSPVMDDEVLTDEESAELEPGQTGAVWVSRITGVIGAIFLLLALVAWQARNGHHRLVLALLIVALFASILHAYTFENGGEV